MGFLKKFIRTKTVDALDETPGFKKAVQQGKVDARGRALDADGLPIDDAGLSTVDTATERISRREIPDVNYTDGAGADLVKGASQYLSKTPQGQVTDAGGFTSAKDAGSYVKGLESALGLKGPVDTRQTAQDAAFGQLDREAYEGSIRDKTNLAAQGQQTGARSQALSTLRGTELAGNRANVAANIEGQYANRMADYERALLGTGAQQAATQSQYGLNRAGQLTNASLANARLEADRDTQRASTALAQGSDAQNRAMQEQQNILNQIAQKNTADMLRIQNEARKDAQIMGGITAGLGAIGGVASAGVGR